jgi:hypothetical protein
VDYEALLSELARAADENRRKIGATTYVPCDYLISLSPRDLDDLEEGNFSALMAQELQRALREYVQQRGYRVQGEVTVRLASNERLDDGYIGVTTSFVPYDPNRVLVDSQTVFRPPQGLALASLEVLSGPSRGQVIAVTRFPATIGRITPHNHPVVGLPDDAVSRHHARLEQQGGKFFLTDLGSLNGTFVNGTRLLPHRRAPLPAGAHLTLGGGITLRFLVGDRSAVQGWQF